MCAQPGLKRYRCKTKGCQRTFNDLTGTLLDGSKRALMHWILATFLVCLSCSSRRIANELGVHIHTGYRWCWWLRNAVLSYEIGRKLAGTVEADELYHTAGHKGQAKTGGTKSLGRKPRGRRKKREPGRGHYDKDRPAMIAWASRQGGVVIQATRDFTVKTVQKAADLAMQTGSKLYTDSASSYRLITGYAHDSVNHTKIVLSSDLVKGEKRGRFEREHGKGGHQGITQRDLDIAFTVITKLTKDVLNRAQQGIGTEMFAHFGNHHAHSHP